MYSKRETAGVRDASPDVPPPPSPTALSESSRASTASWEPPIDGSLFEEAAEDGPRSGPFSDNDMDMEGAPAIAEDHARPNARKEKAAFNATREPGKSHLPFSRVQKILKADKELPLVQREAVWLISVATEEFIKRMAEAVERMAARERRTTAQQRDVALLVQRADEYAFLEGLIEEQSVRRKPVAP
ncbi:uncharacterized protein LAESUDRAFT_754502 [Laetiporus sulphureus 93-53]|uniref:Transcription factor CBF/NF-Y/archaeal histone domain-containing protein n=1 Tax=Laetiporus sulphureus 93-53 TaxID=1314785 RepID=A0A165HNJ2_9APHY|nr:uncharacterized protein LAESUDRAFT_754502 [Laetiporus sulphureus 93-53]KZT11973.1 hypothetical protein LAESUDRAFT_754502 [Laetiporus sulphureus 93-53]